MACSIFEVYREEVLFSPAWLLLALVALVVASRGYAGFGTTVPVTAETATNIARSLFLVSLKAVTATCTSPTRGCLFIDDRRIGLQAHLQAYDHRPEQGIAISEARAVVSGEGATTPLRSRFVARAPHR